MTFSAPDICFFHFPMVQITAPRSTAHTAFRTPPCVLPLTEGGGPESAIISTQIWTVQKGARESTAHIGFRTPPPVLPLTEGGGGGPESVITWAHIWTAQSGALKSKVHIGFRTPPSVLPLMEGGGSGMGVKERVEICGQKASAQINGSK
jgi:hypothetical protein